MQLYEDNISAGDEIIWNISCLPLNVQAPTRLDIWLHSLCEGLAFHPHLILSRYTKGVITNDTKWLEVPLQFQCPQLSQPRVHHLIIHENPTQRATKNFTIAWALTAFESHWYRYIMFIPAFQPITSVTPLEAQLHDNLQRNYSKWCRFCTSTKKNLGLSSHTHVPNKSQV